MKAVFKPGIAALALGAVALAGNASAGATYRFTVNCPRNTQVVQWQVSGGDPGKEALRVSTGMQYPDCIVSDYQDEDADLPRVELVSEELIQEYIDLLEAFLRSFG